LPDPFGEHLKPRPSHLSKARFYNSILIIPFARICVRYWRSFRSLKFEYTSFTIADSQSAVTVCGTDTSGTLLQVGYSTREWRRSPGQSLDRAATAAKVSGSIGYCRPGSARKIHCASAKGPLARNCRQSEIHLPSACHHPHVRCRS
jgi:hypothetical protein